MSFLEEILQTPVEEQSRRLRELSSDARNVQEKTLLDIISINKDTDFGKAHNFDQIRTIQDYKDLVPISDFDDYKEIVEQLKDGEENILFPGKASRFIVTSGTTAFPKYIPHTKLSEDLLKHITFLRQMEIYNQFPDLANPNTKGISIVNPSTYEKTKGGIPTGSASGQAATKNTKSASKMVPPFALMRADLEDINKTDYLTVLFAVAERRINTLGCNDAGHMNTMMNVLNDNIESIIKDIRKGTFSVDIPEELAGELKDSFKADPDRADEIEALYKEKGRLTISDLWPEFGFTICWLASSVGRFAKEYRDIFPKETKFMDAGYGSSEGKFNIPIETDTPYGLPVPYGFLFEFLPLDGKDTVLLDETEDGKLYELIITNYSGFYRYNMHDLVKLRTNTEGFKEIEFIGKTKDKINIDNKTLYAGELTNLIEDYENNNNVFIRYYQGSKDNNGLILEIEPKGDLDFEDFSTYLKEKLEEDGINISQIIKLPNGTRDQKLKERLKQGQKRNQMKTLVFNS